MTINMKNNYVRFLLFFLLFIGGTILDLWSKSWIFGKMGVPGEQGTWWLIPHFFGFQTSLNQGALFGIGQGQTILFVILSVIALFVLMFMIYFDTEKNRFIAMALGMISAGITGNLWDRLALHQMNWTEFQNATGQCSRELVGTPVYAVRDWILVMIGNWPWPNFNLADSYLVVGSILILLYSFFGTVHTQTAVQNEVHCPVEESGTGHSPEN